MKTAAQNLGYDIFDIITRDYPHLKHADLIEMLQWVAAMVDKREQSRVKQERSTVNA